MRTVTHGLALGAALLAVLSVAEFSAQRPPPADADEAINKDRSLRQTALAKGHWAPQPYKPGFFGTIFQLIVGQVNDTKSAYSQITELVNNQFTDDEPAASAPGGGNGTEAPTKISRAEFLRILDRNLKGLRRLRDLEWREAKKDTMANIRAYKLEAQQGRKSTGR